MLSVFGNSSRRSGLHVDVPVRLAWHVLHGFGTHPKRPTKSILSTHSYNQIWKLSSILSID